MERDGRDIIHLGVGDPDFSTPAAIVDAAIASLHNGRTHYSPISGEPDLRATIAASASKQYGVEIRPEQVTAFPGAQCALFASMLCLSGPSDEVLLLEPFYATYEGVASAGGASVVTVPSSPETGFSPDLERIENAVTSKTRVLLANSPGNPTGAVFSEADWLALSALCRKHDIWLVSDEVYSEYVFDDKHYSPISVARDNVVVVNSVSKSYAMTGWRLGWTITPGSMSVHLNNLAQCMLFGVSQFTQDAAITALAGASREVSEMKKQFRLRRDTLCDLLDGIDGIDVLRPSGGMFVMIDVSALGCDGEAFANELLDHSGVAVVPGFAFGDSARNFVRIGYLVEEQQLRVAADKISVFVNSR